MAIQSQPSRISEPFAGSGTKNVIPATNATPSASQAASWASGFPPECSQPISAGGCPVPRNDMNGVLNQLSQDLSFRQDGGVWEWSALADYDVQRVVRGSDGKLYWSVAQSGPGVAAGAQDPTLDTTQTYWGPIDASISGTATDVAINGDQNDLAGANRGIFNALYLSELYPNGVDFDTLTDQAIYDFSSNASNSNNPSGNGTLVVHRGGLSASYVKQIVYRWGTLNSNDYDVYIRTRDPNGNWSNWAKPVFYSHVYTLLPPSDNSQNIGSASFRFKTVYAGTGTINTSDETEKTSIEAVPDDVLDAWESASFFQFKFKDAVEEKGSDSARLHVGLVSQRVRDAFHAAGLDASRYGLYCRDDIPAMDEVKDDDGQVIQPSREAGERFGIRYEEALCLEAACQRRRADRAEARLVALEERLAKVESVLGSMGSPVAEEPAGEVQDAENQ